MGVTAVGPPTFASANGGSVSPGLPAGVASGDRLYALAMLWTGSQNPTGITAPSGWTTVENVEFDNDTRARYALFTKVAGASEPAPTFGASYNDVNVSFSVQVSAWRGEVAAPTYAPTHHIANLAGATQNFPTVDVAASHVPVYLAAQVRDADLAFSSTTVPSYWGLSEGAFGYTNLFTGYGPRTNGTAPQRSLTLSAFQDGVAYFTVAIPSNDPPSAPGAFTSPLAGAKVDTTGTVSWGAASDPDGNTLSYDADLSLDNGATWTSKRVKAAGTSFTYDYTLEAATTAARWRVRAWDGLVYGPYTTSDAFTVEHNTAPTAPTGLSPAGNVVLDRTITQRFSWTFNDPNSGDSQSKYDLRYRVIGGTWTTVTATTTNRFHDFAGGTFAAGDYEWQVLTYDSQGVASPWSASEFFRAATPPAAPSITSPVSGSTVATSSGTVEWSAPSQEAFQVRKVADNAGNPDTATVYYLSEQIVSATARNHGLTYPVNNRYEHIQVRIRVNGLWSTWASIRILVSFTPPATPSVAVSAVDTLGLGGTDALTIAITHPAPTGTEPVVSSSDIYRRTDSGDGIRVAAEVGTSWTDYTPASGVAYEYKAVAHGANGVDSDSVWTS